MPTLKILAKSDTSAASILALERAEHVLGPYQLIAEDSAGHGEEIGDEAVAQRVANRHPFFPGDDDLVRPQHRKMLGHARLVETERGLQLLHRTVSLDQELDDPDADRVGEGLEEAGLERLELPNRMGSVHGL
jgi:hypothetical protein